MMVPGAPVRQALLDAGIGLDVYGVYDDGICQPNYTIYAKNANACDKERFVEIIEDTLKKVVQEGLNKNSLLASINGTEFRFREADYGHYPKGLLYGLHCMDTWLYDDMEVFANLELFDIFNYLKEQVDTGYYEELIQKYLLDNTHGAIISMEPEKGLNNQMEEALEEQLRKYKATFSEEELEALIQETAHLKEYQGTPSPEEDLQKIPMLERKDMRKEVLPYSNIEEDFAGTKVVRHDVFTNGIDYISFYFDAEDIGAEDIPVLGFLRNVLSYVDTENYSYSELSNAINIHTGGISGGLCISPKGKGDESCLVKFEFRAKMLEEKLEEALGLLKEILLSSKLDDVKRLTELLQQTKSRLQSILSSSGHVVSATRSMAYFSEHAYIQEATSGILYYDVICKLEEQIRKEPQAVVARIQSVAQKLFKKERLLISFTGTKENYENAMEGLQAFVGALPQGEVCVPVKKEVLGQQNEAFTDSSSIQYVSRSGNFAKHGFAYTGALHVLKMILSYDYLWINVRIKGGAYGCGSSFLRTGEVYFHSYRDPNLRKTNEIYDKIPEYLRNFEADEREMTKYIIGTLGGLDTPLYPEGKGHRSMVAYLREISLEEVQKERDQILQATDADIRALADLIEAVLSDGHFCVIGNENTIRKEEDMFFTIRSLNE